MGLRGTWWHDYTSPSNSRKLSCPRACIWLEGAVEWCEWNFYFLPNEPVAQFGVNFSIDFTSAGTTEMWFSFQHAPLVMSCCWFSFSTIREQLHELCWLFAADDLFVLLNNMMHKHQPVRQLSLQKFKFRKNFFQPRKIPKSLPRFHNSVKTYDSTLGGVSRVDWRRNFLHDMKSDLPW